jgi:predicted permease
MPLLVKTRSFLRNLFLSHRVDTDLDQEVHSHLAMLIDENIRAGMSPQEAQRAARIELGGIEQVKEQIRQAHIGNWFHAIISDCRYALRQLRKNRGFTIAAVLTLALGIAVNATMFSLVSAFLLRRPPVRDPDRVVVVSSVNPAPAFQADANAVSVPNYLAWREANHVFDEIAAANEYQTVSLAAQSMPAAAGMPNASGQSPSIGQPETLQSAAVSPNYFAVLGVSTWLGRPFEAGEDQPGRDHVVILSYELWQRRFASDRSLIGSTLRLNRENYAVIGVMPESFHLLGFTPQLWTPLVLTEADQTAAARKDRSLRLFARLKPGATLEQARAEFVTLARRAQENFSESEKGWGAKVRTLPDFLVYDFGIRSALAVMMTTVGFVLMIACAHVAGLLLARAAGRRKELAIRIAIGASRIRIALQLLTEGLLIALLGGAAGLLLSYWGIQFVRANLTFNEAISTVPLSLDRNVLLFALAVSLISAVLCGLAPALNASRTDVNTNLKDEGRASSPSRSRSRLRTVMVTGQIMLASFLLIGTGLLLRGIFVIEHQNLGFRADHLLTAGVTLDDAQYKDASRKLLFVRDLLARLRQIAGADSVAIASDLPATGGFGASIPFQIKDQPELSGDQRLSALHVVVSSDYFQTAGIPLLRGRTFAETDNAVAPRVAVVNQEFVHRHLHDQDALGKQIRLDVAGAAPEWSQIVGVFNNVKTYSQDPRDGPEIYEPFQQRPVSSLSLMVRSTSDPGDLASALRGAVSQVDAELPLANVMTMPALIERQKGGDVLFVRLLGTFALLALILAAIGIYGLIAYSVGQRTHEIGIRMALGARDPDVLRMVLREGLTMAAIGAAVGLALALPLPKVFDAMFYGLHLREPRLYLIVPVAILVTAALAAYVPARRASSVDPMVALRNN